MSNLLLTGAGFSKNWGGWLAKEAFEYLLTCKEIRGNETARRMLWTHQQEDGFESALADLRRRYVMQPQESSEALLALQAAVADGAWAARPGGEAARWGAIVC